VYLEIRSRIHSSHCYMWVFNSKDKHMGVNQGTCLTQDFLAKLYLIVSTIMKNCFCRHRKQTYIKSFDNFLIYFFFR